MGDGKQFVSHIKDGMSMFGMELESSSRHGDLQELMFKDTNHGTGYIALAKQTSSKNPGQYWGSIIDGALTDLIVNTAHGNKALPAALIVPSGEAEAARTEAVNRGTRPSAYQLFENFVVLGFNNRDTSFILENKRKADEAVEDASQATARKEEPPSSSKIEPPENIKAPTAEKKGFDLRKIAAAAILGVAIASVPYAVNKFRDGDIPETPPVVEEALESAVSGRPGIPEIQSALASNPGLSPQSVEELLDRGYRMEAAANPNMPPGRFRELVYSGDSKVRAAVAKNPNLPQDYLRQLANDHDPAVRASVASNSAISYGLMDVLSRDHSPQVRSGVLDNPNLTPQMLASMYPDTSKASCDDRERIYASRCITKDILIAAAAGDDECRRRGVARNPLTPAETVNKLTRDSDKAVRRNALANGALPPERTGVFGGKWTDKTAPDEISDINAALTNPSVSGETINLAALNPGRYGVPLASNPALGADRAEKINEYSKPRGGMGGFFGALSAIPHDNRLLTRLNNERASPPAGKTSGSWKGTLRRNVNSKFRDNVFDPVSAAQDIVAASSGDSAPLPSLAGETDGGEFFENPVPDVSIEDTPESFEEFFSGIDLDDPYAEEKIGKIARTADNIVDEIMREMAPAVEKAMDEQLAVQPAPDRTDGKVPASSGESPVSGGDNTGGSAQQEQQQQPKNGGHVPVFPTPASVKAAEPGMYNNVLSQDLYDNSCRHVEDLLKLF